MAENSAARILVVDDEIAIADLVVKLLENEGMRACACYSGVTALELFSIEQFDLLIVDVMMPGIDGLEVCTRLRSVSDVPIIFLSAKDEEADKVVGLMLGGDDYVTKPFKPRELVARVRARLRRATHAAHCDDNVLRAHGIELDLGAHTAFLHGEPLHLTPKEYGILAALVRNAGKPVATKDLFESVWNEPYVAASANSVMVHMRRIRKKLAEVDGSECFVETAWGVGYKIMPRTSNSSASNPHVSGSTTPGFSLPDLGTKR
ncbi:response regulator transcription factor [Adlercreutzia sp. ZJ141]|uniref:response regulator transcription factor n=1 Tax=Adlercreutzia sp. ZJ141 TaxID=2709406 RepID=UPI001F15292E|nr:response regulator transcription factor [Adlercreutzia sp. ZJ141]